MNISIEPYASSGLNSINNTLTSLLKAQAIDAGWPRKYASALQVSIQGSEITIAYPEEFSEQIENLEYGSMDVTPIPVFRTFLEKQKAVIYNSVENSSINLLVDSEIIP